MQANATGVAGAGRTFERVSVVKALAGRKVPVSVAHAFAPGGAELVVVERYKDGLDAAALDQLEQDARAMVALRHPNVAAVRDVWRENGELCIATEYVEGETLEELRRVGVGGKELTIEVGVRVIVDVLAALSGIHGHQGGLAHGEVTAANIIVGFDGTTRLVRPFRGRVAGKVAEADLFSYVAPEVVKGGASDARADLYAVGVLLWETLSRRKLFPKATREGRAARSMPVGKPAPPPDASWAAPLGAVAERALANDPSARYTTAAEMAAAVRLAVRSKLAMPPRVSAAVDKLAGEKILARRNTNALPDPSAPGARTSVRPARPSVPPEAVRALSAMRPSSRPPPAQATPAPAPVIPKTPPLPSLAAKPSLTPKPPRPIAPPLKLADPVPKPSPAEVPPPPSEILDAFVESVREPAPPIPPAKPISTPAPTPVLPIAAEAAPLVPVTAPPQQRRTLVWIAIAALFAFVAIAAVVGVMIGSGSHDTTPVASGHPSTKPTATTTVTATSTVTATAKTSAASTATTSATAEPSATTEPDPTTTAPVDSTHRPHTRPRPTYDPMGI